MKKIYQTPLACICTLTANDIVRTSTQVDTETGDHIQWWTEN